MTPERFRQIEELYDAAAGMDPGERKRFIEEHCVGDGDLRRELMEAFREDSSGLTQAVEHAAAAAVALEDNWTGRRFGPYRILRPLGRGGMGAVWLALRDDDQFHKEVAIKSLRFELEGGPAVLRFRHERQILAHLEHPNIARLLDGGTTETGTPYIVMEYVAGVPISDWCEQQQLSISQRLRLFRQVCEAVQYAHRNLIVHRDIKPGNVLVTPEGVPKLLDFGIAKLLDASATSWAEGPGATATGASLMTPDYASPEQVRGEVVSAVSDVYSLGAMLYQLLTGQAPFTFEKYDLLEIARVVCQSELRPPSALGNHRFRGDLDLIVMKAMQKEASRRYASVVELSEDIRRHLEGLPLNARPDTSFYVASKFVRRHRVGVAAVAAVLAALGAGVAVSLHEARVAQRRFAQVRELANTFLFQFYDQVVPLPGSTGVRALIVDTARKYLDGLAREAGGDRELTMELAEAYQRLGNVRAGSNANLGQVEQARHSYQLALDLYARLPVNKGSAPDLRRRVANVLFKRSQLETSTYHEDAAEPFAHRGLDLLDDHSPDSATRMLRAIGERTLANIRLKQGHIPEALGLMESARQALLDLQSSGYKDQNLHAETDVTRERLARVRVFAGDLDGALRDLQELLRLSEGCKQQGAPGAACRVLGVRLERTADVYAAVDRPNLNEPAKAAELYEQVLGIQERIVALDANDRQARFDLAARCGKLGDAVWRADPKRAIALYERALGIAQALVSKEQFEIFRSSFLIAVSRPLIQLGRSAEARRALAEALDLAKTNAQSPYADRLGEISVRVLWPGLLVAEGKRGDARQALKDLIRGAEALREGHRDDLTLIYYLSGSYRQLASMTSGPERREALLHSAAAWHSWPATSFTQREEQKDLANR